MRVPTTTAAGPVDSLTQDQIDDEFSRIIWTNFSGQLIGNTELTLNPGGTVTANRTYKINGVTFACRTTTVGGSGPTVTWLAADQQGTADLTDDPNTGAMSVRYFDPFGNPRGSTPTWPNIDGYLNDPTNTITGTTRIGARDYLTTLGRFTTADPDPQATDPQSENAYAYADNSPITDSDPSGMHLNCSDGSECAPAIQNQLQTAQAHNPNYNKPINSNPPPAHHKASVPKPAPRKSTPRPTSYAAKRGYAADAVCPSNTVMAGSLCVGGCPAAQPLLCTYDLSNGLCNWQDGPPLESPCGNDFDMPGQPYYHPKSRPSISDHVLNVIQNPTVVKIANTVVEGISACLGGAKAASEYLPEVTDAIGGPEIGVVGTLITGCAGGITIFVITGTTDAIDSTSSGG